jgi:catechol 2,3-dioxygenase-like lactoylglutathione lyase family enzyme
MRCAWVIICWRGLANIVNRRVVLALALLAALAGGVQGQLVTAVGPIGLTVSDLDRSVAFYTEVLTFQKVSEREVTGDAYEHLEGIFGLRMKTAQLRLGDEFIELTEFLAPRGRPAPVASRSNDLWFQHVAIIVSDMDRAYARLRERKVEHASTGPQRLPDSNPKAGGIRAFYFRDPDGHPLEILSFPPDKGAAKWHTAGDRLFLGIDHTAIVVSDTDASLRFYRDVLGMKVAGESENFGIEQERLNNVFGARLRITGLQAGSGPGVEFLEYLAPSDGRPYPGDEKPNDLVHWQTRFIGADVSKAATELLKFKSPMISTGAVELAGREAGYRKAVLARDPDGHVVEIVER